MKKSFMNISIRVIGLIVIAVTLGIFFLLGFKKTDVSWWALCFILLAEIALFMGLEVVGAVKTQLNQVFIRSGVPAVLFLYLTTTIISCLFAGAFKDNVNSFLIIEIIIIAVAAIVIISLSAFSHRIDIIDRKTANSGRLMQMCEKRIYNLLVDTKNRDFEGQLNSLYENIKFSDKVGTSSVDEKVATMIIKLEQVMQSTDADNEIYSIFDEISTLITQRKMEVAGSKRGGF